VENTRPALGGKSPPSAGYGANIGMEGARGRRATVYRCRFCGYELEGDWDDEAALSHVLAVHTELILSLASCSFAEVVRVD